MPQLAGVAALLKQACPALTPAQIKAILIKSARDVTTGNCNVATGGNPAGVGPDLATGYSAERERACDDLVLGVGTRASEYAVHLLQIVCRAARSRTPAVALPMAQRHEFEGRMLAILERVARREPASWRHGALLAALALALILPLAALAPSRPAITSAGPVNVPPAVVPRTDTGTPRERRLVDSRSATATSGQTVTPDSNPAAMFPSRSVTSRQRLPKSYLISTCVFEMRSNASLGLQEGVGALNSYPLIAVVQAQRQHRAFAKRTVQPQVQDRSADHRPRNPQGRSQCLRLGHRPMIPASVMVFA